MRISRSTPLTSNRGGRRTRAGRRGPRKYDTAPPAEGAVTVAGREFPAQLVATSTEQAAQDSAPASPQGERTPEERHADLLKAIYRARIPTTERGVGQSGVGLDWSLPLLPQLSAVQQVAAAMAARGYRWGMIQEVTGLSASAVYEWRRAVWWPLALKEAIEELITSPTSALASMVPQALQTYENLLKADDRAVAENVLDRVWGKPVVRQQIEEVHDITVTFEDLPD